jgi:hypothetical protein
MSAAVRFCLKQQLAASRVSTAPTANRLGTRVLSPLQVVGNRYFSDRMMGYSPMSPPTPNDSTSAAAKMPTAQDVTTSGGVWAPTSAKRDKMSELLLALEEGQRTLDDAATDEQKLDLYLADGLDVIAKAVEQQQDAATSEILQNVENWLDEKARNLPEDLHQVQWESYLTEVSRKAESMASEYPPERSLRNVRDFYECKPDENETQLEGETGSVDQPYQDCVIRYRLGLLQAEANHLLESWNVLTQVSDADVDRAAVEGIALDPQASTLPLSKLNNVLKSFVGGTCGDRVAATWDLMDKDGDGRLDEAEMNQVAYMVVSPIETSLQTLFQDAIAAYPVRDSLDSLGNDGDESESPPKKKGWRARRREKRTEKRLQRIFSDTLKTHFQDEVEMPHRLRCIYAWADKAHQNNKIDSIHVESTDWGSRQRYVELEPKISLAEFQEVQQEHFTHLDRVGQELIKSFRENLLVDQGKGRQSSELKRDCMLFLTAVSIVDFIILSL